MSIGRVWPVPNFVARLFRLALASSMVFLGTTSSTPRVSIGLYHDELPHAASGEVSETTLVVYEGQYREASYRLMADVVVDEEFVTQVGERWRAEVLEIVAGANVVLEPVGIFVEVVSIQQVASDDTLDSMSMLLKDVGKKLQRTQGRLLIVITCQDTVKYDGWANASHNEMAVRFYHTERERNSSLVAHELGHVLGARHHEQEHECIEDGCIMDQQGYANATHWCQHHIDVLHDSTQLLVATQQVPGI